jgi:hypothetical protein
MMTGYKQAADLLVEKSQRSKSDCSSRAAMVISITCKARRAMACASNQGTTFGETGISIGKSTS